MTWYAFAAKKKLPVSISDIVLLFLQEGSATDPYRVFVGTAEGGVQPIPHARNEIVFSGENLVFGQDIAVDIDTRALVTPYPSLAALRKKLDSVIRVEDLDLSHVKKALSLCVGPREITLGDFTRTATSLELIARKRHTVRCVEVNGVIMFLGTASELKDLWSTLGFLDILKIIRRNKCSNPGHTSTNTEDSVVFNESLSDTSDKEIPMEPTSENSQKATAVSTDPIQYALSHSIDVSMLFGGDPLVVLRTKEASAKDYDRILGLPYKFFCAFETSLYIIPFVQKDAIEYTFFVHTSDIRENPEFLNAAESWISGFIEGTEKV